MPTLPRTLYTQPVVIGRSNTITYLQRLTRPGKRTTYYISNDRAGMLPLSAKCYAEPNEQSELAALKRLESYMHKKISLVIFYTLDGLYSQVR